MSELCSLAEDWLLVKGNDISSLGNLSFSPIGGPVTSIIVSVLRIGMLTQQKKSPDNIAKHII